MELRCSVIQLKEGSLDRVKEWASAINSRKEEALKTLKNEGVTIESFFLVTLEEKDFLVAYMRASSVEKARASVKTSLHEIDAYHQEFKRSAWEKKFDAELLVDLSRIENEEGYL